MDLSEDLTLFAQPRPRAARMRTRWPLSIGFCRDQTGAHPTGLLASTSLPEGAAMPGSSGIRPRDRSKRAVSRVIFDRPSRAVMPSSTP